MAASSVTGVGQGSADKSGQKGSEHLFVGVEKLIGTRVWYSGTVTMTSTATTVTLPEELPGADSDYIVIGSVQGAAHAVGFSSVTPVSTGTFVINGTNSDVIGYAVILVTNATVTGWPTANLG